MPGPLGPVHEVLLHIAHGVHLHPLGFRTATNG
jgi:hypothetical protein